MEEPRADGVNRREDKGSPPSIAGTRSDAAFLISLRVGIITRGAKRWEGG